MDLAPDTQLAAAGDRDALQRLIVQHHAALHRAIAAAIAPSLAARVDADDVLQQAYVEAFRALQAAGGRQEGEAPAEPDGGPCRFASPAAFYRWLEQIALNELKNRKRDLRRAKRDIGREVAIAADAHTSYPDLFQQLTGSESTPSRKVGKVEAAATVLSSLARLTADQRTVVELRFLHSLPVPEVAARLGKTEEAIHALTYRALKELRAAMGSITNYLSHL